MKYVWIAVVVVLMTRIDFFLELFQSTSNKIARTTSREVKVNEVVSDSQIIPLKNDQAIQVSPRLTFLTMLEDFRGDPSADLRNSAMDLLRAQPSMFTDKLDRELESGIYRWRDLLVQRQPEVHNFLQDLLNTLKGENAEMVRRFYSFGMDVNMADFLNAYARSKDSTCQVGILLADPLPEDERYNELAERLSALEEFLKNEKLDTAVKVMALRCETAIKLALEKMRLALPAPEAAAPEGNLLPPIPSPSPEPNPTPAPQPPVPSEPPATQGPTP